MKYFITIYLLSIFSAFGYGKIDNPIVEKANQQTIILEKIVKSYMQLNSNPKEIRAFIGNNRKIFNQNMDDLFSYAEDYGIDMIRLIGAEYNAWGKFVKVLDLPLTKKNQEKVFLYSKEIVQKNDKILEALRPTLLIDSTNNTSFNF